MISCWITRTLALVYMEGISAEVNEYVCEETYLYHATTTQERWRHDTACSNTNVCTGLIIHVISGLSHRRGEWPEPNSNTFGFVIVRVQMNARRLVPRGRSKWLEEKGEEM